MPKAIFEPGKGVAQYMEKMIKAPYVHAQVSTLGGPSCAGVIVRISLDPKAKWVYGIYHNSRYAMFDLRTDGSLELFAKKYNMPKMRKTRVTGLPGAVEKITKYIRLARKA